MKLEMNRNKYRMISNGILVIKAGKRTQWHAESATQKKRHLAVKLGNYP
jgi:hypothetical protein